MSAYTITIDGGTTNTRCVLWNNNREKVAEQKREIGVRNTAVDGNNHKLKSAVKECLEQLLDECSITYGDIDYIIASGMLTSDVGIVEIPHLTAPAGLEEIARKTLPVDLPEICPVPIYFIPGIKNTDEKINLSNFESMDIMRGEEVESLAIINECHTGSPMVLVLPGSHNKFVAVSKDKKITGCLTSISGELLSAITNDTIIAKSVNKQFVNPKDYNKEWMLTGYRNAKKTGIGRACFSARILNLFSEKDSSKIANYILGVSLQCDITALLNTDAIRLTPDTQLVICGKEPLKQALTDIFNEEKTFSHIMSFDPPGEFTASSFGAYLVAEKI